MRQFLKPLDKTGYAALLASFVAGLYVTVFYTLNNLTMLQEGGIFFIFSIVTIPLLGLTIFIYYPLHLAGKGDQAQIVVVFIISAFLLFLLRPTLLGIGFVGGFYGIFAADQYILANILFVLIPSILLTVVFKKNVQKYAMVLGIMTITAVLMNFGQITGDRAATAAVKKLSPQLQSVSLKEKPNIYFILADGYSSLAYMKDHGIDVSNLTEYLSDNGFRLYEDTYSNYQPTTNAMPAILDMDHHYYSLIGHRVHFSEVSKAARMVIGGENNVSYILRRNGYSIQYIHNGTYLLLQGCSADVCFPQIDGLAGARIILSYMFKTDLLSEQDKAWESQTLEQMREQVATLMDDDRNSPRFQYIHALAPSHAPNHLEGKCDESSEVQKYARRVEWAGEYLRKQISEIIERDPDALIMVAGDHGPFISKKCSRTAYIDKISDYRDRAGALMAIRWSKSYDGKYDDRIVSGVNLFRYVLASLAEDETPLLQTAVPDDVFIMGHRIFKIIDNGKPLFPPEEFP